MALRGSEAPEDLTECNDRGKGTDSARTGFWGRRVRLLVAFFIILAMIFLTILFILEFTRSTEILKRVRAKRFVRMDDYYDESESIETSQKDVQIIPEKGLVDFARRAAQHPNHRYRELEGDGRKKEPREESGRSPTPFGVNAEEYLDSVRIAMAENKAEGKTRRGELVKGLQGSMRVKGVLGYVPPKGRIDPSEESFYYSKEINNLMENHSGNGGGEGSAVRKRFQSRGAPFRVPTKDVPGRGRLNAYRPTRLKTKESLFEKRPLTILLDIYPMTDSDDYFNKEGPRPSHVVKPPRSDLSKLGDAHSPRKFLFPRERRNGIIMKLNLYTKGRKSPRRQNSIGKAEEANYLTGHKRAEEKSFGWFGGKGGKQQEAKECSLMSLQPHGKHVTAKWKNEKGEWIHAERLSVNHLKKDE